MRIFLSYRRDDAAAWAGRLTDSLAARFGADNIFQDVTALRPGVNYVAAIDEALRRSDVALAVIGPGWSTAAHPDGSRRLADESDDVRSELRSALANTPQVIPVLVGEARMPTSSELPADLAPLALLQAVSIRDETWHRDVDELVRAIAGRNTGPARRRWPLVAGASAAVVGAVVAAVLWVGGDGDGRTAGTGSAPTTAVSATTFDPLRPIDECPSVATSEWTSLGLTGTAPIGDVAQPAGRLDVTGSHGRDGESGGRALVVDATYTNNENHSQNQYWWLYSLVADGQNLRPTCFSVLGGTAATANGEHIDVRIGFLVEADPTAGSAVLAKVEDQLGRVELQGP